MTGSSRCTWANVVSPRMRSWTTVAPSSGTRRRTAPESSASPRKPRSAPCCGLVGVDLGLRRRRAVGVALVEQLLEHLLVALGARDLADRALVVVEPQPAQRVEDLLDVLGGRALAVGIFDAQDERPAVVSREQPVVQRRARAADVQRARSGKERSGPSCALTVRDVSIGRLYADRRPRLPGGRAGEGRRARRASAARRRSRSSTRTRGRGSRATTPTRRSPRSARRWRPPTSARC